MKKTVVAPIILYIIDDQSYYVDDLRRRYEDSGKYAIHVFSSLHRFTEHLSQQTILKQGIKIAIISLKSNNGQENTPEVLTRKLLTLFPFLSIIKVTEEKEMPTDESYKQSGRLIFVKRNENTLLRIDNGVKLIVGQRTYEIKEKQKRIAYWIFFASISLFLIAALFVKILFPKIFYF